MWLRPYTMIYSHVYWGNATMERGYNVVLRLQVNMFSFLFFFNFHNQLSLNCDNVPAVLLITTTIYSHDFPIFLRSWRVHQLLKLTFLKKSSRESFCWLDIWLLTSTHCTVLQDFLSSPHCHFREVYFVFLSGQRRHGTPEAIFFIYLSKITCSVNNRVNVPKTKC